MPSSTVLVRWIAALCVAALAASALCAQEGDLTAKRRMFPEVGAGLRALRRGVDGRYYILQSPAPGLVVYSPDEKPILQIGAALAANPAPRAHPFHLVFGEHCDLAPSPSRSSSSSTTKTAARPANSAIPRISPNAPI